MWLKGVLGIYGAFLAAAGIYGFVARGSKESMYGGVGAGVLVLIAILLASWKPAVGYVLAIVVAVAMIGRFLPAFLKETNPINGIWPHLTIVILSAVVLVCLILGHFLQKKA